MLRFTGSETILIVDDEIVVLSLTSMMLKRFGYEVITAMNAEEALKCFTLWSDLKVDLLLVDIILPGMNGLELASRVKELRPQLPVIFMSGYSERELLGRVLVQEIAYLVKPFTSLQLTRRVREVLDGKDYAQAAAGAET